MTATIKLFTLFMLVSTIAFGQSKVKMGFSSGPSLTTLKGDAFLYSNKPTIGYRAGLFVQYDFTELIAIKTNLAYSNKSTIQEIKFADDFGEFTGPIKTRINYNYLVLSVLPNISVGQKTKFYLNIGPFVGVLLSQKSKNKTESIYEWIYVSNNQNSRRMDFGISSGIGTEIPINDNLKLSIDITNETGLISVVEDEIFFKGKAKTNSTSLSLGIIYHFKSKS